MDLLWLMVFLSIVVFLVVLLPFAIFYYEADDGEDNPKTSQWGEAIKMELGTILVAAALLTVLYLTSAKSSIPMRALAVSSTSASEGFQPYVDGTTLPTAIVAAASNVTVQHIKLTLDVSLPVYMTGLTSFVGWFGFSIFCGIGIVALPLDLILYVAILSFQAHSSANATF